MFIEFKTLQDFQNDFKSTLSKFHKSGKSISKDLQIKHFYMGWTKLTVN